MKYYKVIYTMFLLSFLAKTGSSQDFYYKQYTHADGLPNMTTYEMAQDKYGVIWVGTENGLVSFDGKIFTTYTHPDLKDNDIIKVKANKDGDILFINLSHQIGKVVDGEIKILLSGHGQRYDLAITSTADYIIAGEATDSFLHNKAYELKDDKLEVFVELKTKRKSDSFSAMHPENSFYYLIEEDSLHLIKHKNRLEFGDDNDDRFKLFDFENEKYKSISNVYYTDYHADYKNEKLALLSNNKYHIVSDEFCQKYNFTDVQRMVVYPDKYFIILQNRLDVYYPKSNEGKTLLDDIIVNTVFQDNENNLWVSTRNRGLLKINQLNINLRSFKQKEQIITKIISIENYILILWDDEIEIRNKQNEKVFSYDFQSNKESSVIAYNNKFYIGSWQLFTWVGPPDFELNSANSTSSLFKSLEFIAPNLLYVGRTHKIHKVEIIDSTMKFLGEVDLNRIYALKYSKNQKILLAGTSSGLYSIDDQENHTVFIEELGQSNISDITESKDSSFWIATKTEGIFRIKNEKVISHIDISNGLISNVINDLDIQGQYLYAATSNSISQINMNNSQVVNKNSFNGLPYDVITDICIFNDSIWLAIENDIVVIDSTYFHHENLPSVLVMKDFYCNNNRVDFENGMSFEHDENKIDIILNNVSLSSGDNKSIKYRIQNIDTTWTYSNESAIRLPALQPGKYLVEAIGINAVREESKTEKFSFEIKPPWWKTLWARVLSFLILIGIVNTIIIYRGRRIRKEEIVKRDYLSQINKIKDQALQLQMNPHFIFNSLNAIQGFIGTDEEEMAMNYLARFARLIRLIFEHSKGNTITLEEELEFINLYLDLEKLRFKDKVNIKIIIDPNVENVKDIINVPPLLIQPIIENSFKHGLFHKKGNGNLVVKYTLQEEILQVIIQDDGIGRVEAKKISKHNSEKQTSSGINTTIERINLLNFSKKKKMNGIEIEDLYDNEGNTMGTKTTLKLSI